jgi:hypothetical protein
MKILFPGGEATKEDIEMILEFAVEGRKRVKDQLMRIDTTYPDVSFEYTNLSNGAETQVETAEEKRYPQHYYKKPGAAKDQAQTKVVKPEIQKKKQSEEEKLIESGENANLEFKSTLRWNVKADRSDKRIENSALKTVVAFLNTEGGTLLVGVEDDGSILGIEPDRFANDDKYLLHFANLLNDRIGKQYLDQIRWELKEVDDKKILRVDCKPSSTPVFLKVNGEEQFYIRSGPSSIQLSPSEVLEYSRKHFR